MWVQIIYSVSWLKKALKDRINLILIKSENNSLYFLLVITLCYLGLNWVYCSGLYKSIKGKTYKIVIKAPLEKYFNNFTLNINSILNYRYKIYLLLE